MADDWRPKRQQASGGVPQYHRSTSAVYFPTMVDAQPPHRRRMGADRLECLSDYMLPMVSTSLWELEACGSVKPMQGCGLLRPVLMG